MSMFSFAFELIDGAQNEAMYRFFPDRLHARGASGTVRINALDWSHSIVDPSGAEDLGAVSSDEGCISHLIPRLKARYDELGAWPALVDFIA
jgi:hypothetical protein